MQAVSQEYPADKQFKDDKTNVPSLYTRHTFFTSLFFFFIFFAGVTLGTRSFPSPQEPHSWLLTAPALALGFSPEVLRCCSHLQSLHCRALLTLVLALCCDPELLLTVPCLLCTSPAPTVTAGCRGEPLVVTSGCPPAASAPAALP